MPSGSGILPGYNETSRLYASSRYESGLVCSLDRKRNGGNTSAKLASDRRNDHQDGRRKGQGTKRTDEGLRLLRDCEHGGPAANASYPRLGGAYAIWVQLVMGQLVSYRGSSVRGRKVYPVPLLAKIGNDAR
ncbi:PREDICTED: uncharacterized protein LOC105145373 [Acromyrmex echinatior]|uniref:uncharacterized protein LOC105145373 n=1 Tax=Acromyrmex echinatior TaxID=103372 RepID=UPI000580F4A4|nr:PREDICTED: uncharacterized protein LOC105145373 [Acromyrmex echinatior]